MLISAKLFWISVTNVLSWLVAFVVALSVLYGVYEWNQGSVPGLVISTLYTCTNKFAWSLALGWVTIACMTGNGGIVTDILSWEAFVPLGRLTYMAYLVHPIIQFLYIGSTRTLIRTDHRTMLYMYLGDVVLAFMCAYGLSLLFESPFMALEKVIFSSRRPTRAVAAPEAARDDRKNGKDEPDAELEKNTVNIFSEKMGLDNQNNYLEKVDLGKDSICAIRITKIDPHY